ncbi:sigma-54 interaction domain-containing protein [Desulfovibrio sp. TomC]|uniref:sigma-54 interaction domain-containing protein n=1 Tax=Desulfovibrio sp. TomC TaxID=1562888 RepID=UPI0005746193|nr:sigma 54-interacting transcriptional regulator [Desulfovibrio sp. TomC]KHK04473.1 Response regulator of zinc sigma-54-dependent two-component system [Desulfovibrio sp. TomC]
MEFEKHLREIVNTMSEGLLLVGANGAIAMVNEALTRLTGYGREELVGQSCRVFDCDLCERERGGGGGAWCRLFAEKTTRAKRCMIRRKDGTYLPVLKNQSLLRDTAGQPLFAVETLTDLSELAGLDRKVEELTRLLSADEGFHGMIGASPAMRRVFDLLERAAGSDAPVLLVGESGTGKELAAWAIHELGRRRQGPFIPFNCAALSEALLESELFGHAKGAFTGAHRHRQGRFEAADGGDIFLDEIGDAPASIQVKLLRVLETKRFERVGENRSVRADVRVISATNRDLSRLVAAGRFREDLFFRINVIPIELPPLRTRLEDLAPLAEHFLRRLASQAARPVPSISPEAMRILLAHPWPGNVRELKSALEYAFVVTDAGPVEPRHLPPSLLMPASQDIPAAVCRPGVVLEAQRSELVTALRQAGGNRSKAARILGVSRGTILNRMRRYGVDSRHVLDY